MIYPRSQEVYLELYSFYHLNLSVKIDELEEVLLEIAVPKFETLKLKPVLLESV